MDKNHLPETSNQHCKASPVLEPGQGESSGTTRTLMVMGTGSRHQEIEAERQAQLERKAHERDIWTPTRWPVSQEGIIGISK